MAEVAVAMVEAQAADRSVVREEAEQAEDTKPSAVIMDWLTLAVEVAVPGEETVNYAVPVVLASSYSDILYQVSNL